MIRRSFPRSGPTSAFARSGLTAIAVALAGLPALASAQSGSAPGIPTAEEQVEDRVRDPETGEELSEEDVAARAEAERPSDPFAALLEAGEVEGPVAFEADTISYNSTTAIVTAQGSVIVERGGQLVEADAISWDRNTGLIEAIGNVRLDDGEGTVLYSERVELTQELRAGALDNFLLVLEEGGRLAANRGERLDDGTVALDTAAYSACAVIGPDGCPKDPSWRITSRRVRYDPETGKVAFDGAALELFGLRLLPLPGLTVDTREPGVSGVLLPNLRFSRSNGVEVSGSYYMRLDPNRDLTLGASVFTESLPMVSAQYRQLTGNGAFQATGYLTRSGTLPLDGTGVSTEENLRGYVFANGRFQFDPNWSFTASARVASDRTFLRRYDLSRDDRLRSTFALERIGGRSYFSLGGWATQTLRAGDPQGNQPIALPLIDWRWRPNGDLAGGRLELQANTLALLRTDGQDARRAFARAEWQRRSITPWGQQLTLTALARADAYHSDENARTVTALYRGEEGFQGRTFATLAVDLEYPLVGEAFGGTQVFTPRIQLVATPPTRNLAIPNEDARALELEDSNLFALNRFPGYDRIEDGVRLSYGFDWQMDRPGWRVKTTLAQSYRFNEKERLLPDGTGLSEEFSDFVGRTEVRWQDVVQVTHRFRLDKDNFAVRRNEIDLALGSRETYFEAGYLRLNRDIVSIEDLQDREELRMAGRVAFADYWSVFGSAVINLTDREEDPSFLSDGFEPLRTRLGVAYDDDCLEIGLTWRRDFVSAGDARKGDTFFIDFNLKNLGFR